MKSNDLNTTDRVSCNHYVSREHSFTSNDHSHVLKRFKDNRGTMVVDNDFDRTYHFAQTNTEGLKAVEANHEFERFTASCGVKIKHCYTDNKIFNKCVFRESCIDFS